MAATSFTYGGLTVIVERKDILKAGTDVIVNAANIKETGVRLLRPWEWGGVAGVIYKAQTEEGQSVIDGDWGVQQDQTPGRAQVVVNALIRPYKFKDKSNARYYLIHAYGVRGPVTATKRRELQEAYFKVFEEFLALQTRQKNIDPIQSVALVPLGIGLFHVPPVLSAELLWDALQRFVKDNLTARFTIHICINPHNTGQNDQDFESEILRLLGFTHAQKKRKTPPPSSSTLTEEDARALDEIDLSGNDPTRSFDPSNRNVVQDDGEVKDNMTLGDEGVQVVNELEVTAALDYLILDLWETLVEEELIKKNNKFNEYDMKNLKTSIEHHKNRVLRAFPSAETPTERTKWEVLNRYLAPRTTIERDLIAPLLERDNASWDAVFRTKGFQRAYDKAKTAFRKEKDKTKRKVGGQLREEQRLLKQRRAEESQRPPRPKKLRPTPSESTQQHQQPSTTAQDTEGTEEQEDDQQPALTARELNTLRASYLDSFTTFILRLAATSFLDARILNDEHVQNWNATQLRQDPPGEVLLALTPQQTEEYSNWYNFLRQMTLTRFSLLIHQIGNVPIEELLTDQNQAEIDRTKKEALRIITARRFPFQIPQYVRDMTETKTEKFMVDFMTKFVRNTFERGFLDIRYYQSIFTEELLRRRVDGTDMPPGEVLPENNRPFYDLLYYKQLTWQLRRRMLSPEVTEELWNEYHEVLLDVSRYFTWILSPIFLKTDWDLDLERFRSMNTALIDFIPEAILEDTEKRRLFPAELLNDRLRLQWVLMQMRIGLVRQPAKFPPVIDVAWVRRVRDGIEDYIKEDYETRPVGNPYFPPSDEDIQRALTWYASTLPNATPQGGGDDGGDDGGDGGNDDNDEDNGIPPPTPRGSLNGEKPLDPQYFDDRGFYIGRPIHSTKFRTSVMGLNSPYFKDDFVGLVIFYYALCIVLQGFLIHNREQLNEDEQRKRLWKNFLDVIAGIQFDYLYNSQVGTIYKQLRRDDGLVGMGKAFDFAMRTGIERVLPSYHEFNTLHANDRNRIVTALKTEIARLRGVNPILTIKDMQSLQAVREVKKSAGLGRGRVRRRPVDAPRFAVGRPRGHALRDLPPRMRRDAEGNIVPPAGFQPFTGRVGNMNIQVGQRDRPPRIEIQRQPDTSRPGPPNRFVHHNPMDPTHYNQLIGNYDPTHNGRSAIRENLRLPTSQWTRVPTRNPAGYSNRKFQFALEDIPEYSSYLWTTQCEHMNPTGRQCSRKTVIGLRFCWQHLAKDLGLRIADSVISGKGVFAAGHPNTVVFQPGDLVCYYDGLPVTKNELDALYVHPEANAPYAIVPNPNTRFYYTNDNRRYEFHPFGEAEDGAWHRGIGSMVNSDHENPNTLFALVPMPKDILEDDRVFFNNNRPIPYRLRFCVGLVATQQIRGGEEIKVDYGAHHEFLNSSTTGRTFRVNRS